MLEANMSICHTVNTIGFILNLLVPKRKGKFPVILLKLGYI